MRVGARREILLTEAVRLFHQYGYHAVGMEEIGSDLQQIYRDSDDDLTDADAGHADVVALLEHRRVGEHRFVLVAVTERDHVGQAIVEGHVAHRVRMVLPVVLRASRARCASRT